MPRLQNLRFTEAGALRVLDNKWAFYAFLKKHGTRFEERRALSASSELELAMEAAMN